MTWKPVTNAAGGLHPEYSVGDLVVLQDHINLAGLAGIHPLRGPNVDSFGIRFPAMSDAYDLDLRRRVHQSWSRVEKNPSRRLHEGVYAFVCGPSYETRAECRLLRNSGADLVGMSTVPEIIVARHCDIRVVAISLVTNCAVLDPGPRGGDAHLQQLDPQSLAATLNEGKASHEEVLEASRSVVGDLQTLLYSVIQDLLSPGQIEAHTGIS